MLPPARWLPVRRRRAPPQLERPLDRVLRRLVGHDAQRGPDRRAVADLAQQVQVLAGGDLGAHGVQGRLAVAEHIGREAAGVVELVGPGQQHVPDEDRRTSAELLGRSRLTCRTELPGSEKAGELPVHGRPAAPGVAGVHDVVVHEGAGLQQFQGRRGGVDLRAVLAAGRPPAPVAERRAQPLAARQQALHRIQARQQVVADRRQVRALARQEQFEGAGHLGADPPEAGLTIRGWCACHACRE